MVNEAQLPRLLLKGGALRAVAHDNKPSWMLRRNLRGRIQKKTVILDWEKSADDTHKPDLIGETHLTPKFTLLNMGI